MRMYSTLTDSVFLMKSFLMSKILLDIHFFFFTFFFFPWSVVQFGVLAHMYCWEQLYILLFIMNLSLLI